jgi:hypothetical protein
MPFGEHRRGAAAVIPRVVAPEASKSIFAFTIQKGPRPSLRFWACHPGRSLDYGFGLGLHQ